MKIVITVIGEDKVGIIAAVSAVLAKNGVNILTISQTILDGIFNMVMICEMPEGSENLSKLQEELARKSDELHVQIKAQHQDIFKSMHRID